LLYFASTYKARIRCGERKFKFKMRETLMEHINRIELQGRVGNVRTNEYNGGRVANFSLVTELLYKNKEGAPISETTWHNIVSWEGKDTPSVSEITKGTPVYVSGRLRSVKYTNAEGAEKHFYEVLASKVKILKEDTESFY
jgi:single-strand DNA-binding protein